MQISSRHSYTIEFAFVNSVWQVAVSILRRYITISLAENAEQFSFEVSEL